MSTSGDQETLDDEGQPLVEHLLELRTRLLHSLIAVVIVFAPLFYFANELYVYISEPLRQFMPEGATMIATQVASPFVAPLKLSLTLAIFISIPYILHQLWSFVAPGLYGHEKRVALPLLISSILLFYCGMAFAFYVVFPVMFNFLANVAPNYVVPMTDINQYLDFVLQLFFAFGVAFETPIATVLLILTGVTTAENLRKKRPYVVLGCFIAGMILTPPDFFSQLLLAIPMWILFEAGILFALMIQKPAEASEN